MARYIDADALIDRVTRMWESRQITNTKYKCFTEILTAEPTADVVERKRGKWTHDGSKWANRFICSECGYKLFDEPTNFCPNCGADMRGEGDEG